MTAERFPVEASHIMMFARAIGDPNPAYRKSVDAQGDAPVAPPTFPMAASQFDPENPLMPRVGEPWFGSASGPGFIKGGGGSGLHAEQIFEYHRPIRAGDVLTGQACQGNTWNKASSRGGSLRFTEHIVEYHDQHGDPVVTVTMVSVVPQPDEAHQS